MIAGDLTAHLRRAVIAGSAAKITDDISALREAVGDFGTLHIIDPAGSDAAMTRGSMIKLAEKVMPLIGRADATTPKTLETT